MSEKSSTDMVLETIQEMYDNEQTVTRQGIADITGLPMSIIDDRISVLLEDGLIARLQRGVFMPKPRYNRTRAVSKTVLPDGVVIIEVGDHVLHLNPREARALGQCMMGDGYSFHNIQAGKEFYSLRSELEQRVGRLEVKNNGGRQKNGK